MFWSARLPLAIDRHWFFVVYSYELRTDLAALIVGQSIANDPIKANGATLSVANSFRAAIATSAQITATPYVGARAKRH
jgi:hypothetical protein